MMLLCWYASHYSLHCELTCHLGINHFQFYIRTSKYIFRLALHSRHIPGRDPLDREGSCGQAEEEVVGGAEGRRLLQGELADHTAENMFH